MAAGDVSLRAAQSEAEIAACFAVMQSLRPHLSDVADFVTRVARQGSDGYRLLAAHRGSHVVGVAGWRLQENLIHGRFLYVDDLAVEEDGRGGGIGRLLLDRLKAVAADADCGKLVLDTALTNVLAQRFYFRAGLLPSALRFNIPVASDSVVSKPDVASPQ